MAIVALNLANGTVNNTKSTVYTGVSGKVTLLKSMIFHNTNSTPEVLIVYLKDASGSSVVIAQQTLVENSTFTLHLKSPFHLEFNDLLEAETTTGAVVNYWISGIELDTPVSGVIPSHLADGQASNVLGDIYTSPALTTTYITTMAFCNSAGTGDGTFLKIYLNDGADILLLYIDLKPDEVFYWDTPIVLDAGDKIRAEAENATEIDYWIDGMTEA